MLLRMFEKRLRTYRAIGYARGEAPLGLAEPPEERTIEYDEKALRHLEEEYLKGKSSKSRPRRRPTGGAALDRLIEEAIVDAYGGSEQRVGFYTMIEEHLQLPFETEILGVPVIVDRVDMADDEQIVAICGRGRSRQSVPILDLPLPKGLPAGGEWIEAYRRWIRRG